MDHALDRWFFVQREATFDAITEWGSMLGDTMAVVGIAAVAVVVLAIGRHWAHIAFLVGALVIEVTTFVTTTFVIDRERPTVPHLDPGPPTSSFPRDTWRRRSSCTWASRSSSPRSSGRGSFGLWRGSRPSPCRSSSRSRACTEVCTIRPT